MRGSRLVVCLALMLGCAAARAQLPSAAEFHEALDAARPEARALGLQLRSDALWQRAWQARTPLLAALSAGTCHIGYSAYAPRNDFNRLFPELPQPERGVWLAGAIRHELAHCADLQERAGSGQAPATDQPSRHEREALADLAFALHVTRHSRQGLALVARLAELRAAHAPDDPGHDTSAALRCFVSHSEAAGPSQQDAAHAGGPPAAPAGQWWAMLRAWQERCHDRAR
jgi:hypothetical protein